MERALFHLVIECEVELARRRSRQDFRRSRSTRISSETAARYRLSGAQAPCRIDRHAVALASFKVQEARTARPILAFPIVVTPPFADIAAVSFAELSAGAWAAP